MDDAPDLIKAAWLLGHARLRGFTFHSDALARGGPLVASRVSEEWLDTIHLEGFTRDCFAWRQRADHDGGIEHQVEGSAVSVLTEALTWGTTRHLSDTHAAHHAGNA